MNDYRSPERDLVDLILGKKKPKNKTERNILRDIKKLKVTRKKGWLIEIPHD
jgi:succinate dehydrogenase flavin-adding protein (antitoxin of CptAB toxin-antitoxin module)